MSEIRDMADFAFDHTKNDQVIADYFGKPTEDVRALRQALAKARADALEDAAKYLERRADEIEAAVAGDSHRFTAIGLAKILRGEAAAIRALGKEG